MFGLTCYHPVLCRLCHLRHSQQHYAEYCRCAAHGSPPSWCSGASPRSATMFATGPTSLYVLRILVGITEAGFLPGILLYLTFWFPAYFRARANALFMVAMPVTTALGSIASGYILSLDGVMALKGWQCGCCFAGRLPVSVLLGVMVWFWLDDSPDKAQWLTKEDKKCLQEMMDNDRLTLVQPEGAIRPATPCNNAVCGRRSSLRW